MMNVKEYANRSIDEVSEVISCMDEKSLECAFALLNNKKNIFFSGMGRSGDMCKAIAIRFMHLGFNSYVAGDPETPAIKNDDVLIAVSSSGKTKVTINHIETAKAAGAKIILITAKDLDNHLADIIIEIPAKTKIASRQHAGSLFEQSVLICGDAIATRIMEENNISNDFMNSRHANLQ